MKNKRILRLGIALIFLALVAGIVYAQSLTPGYYISTNDSTDFMIYIGDFDDNGWCPLALEKRATGRASWSGYGKIRGNSLEAFPDCGGSGDPGRGHFSIRINSSSQIVYNGTRFNSQYGN